MMLDLSRDGAALLLQSALPVGQRGVCGDGARVARSQCLQLIGEQRSEGDDGCRYVAGSSDPVGEIVANNECVWVIRSVNSQAIGVQVVERGDRMDGLTGGGLP